MTSASAILVDTDILVDHLRGARRVVAAGRPLAYSVITRAELFAGAGNTESIRPLLDAMTEVPVGREVAEIAGQIRQKHRTDLADALIAATAVAMGAPLMTRNRKHYRAIAGLQLL